MTHKNLTWNSQIFHLFKCLIENSFSLVNMSWTYLVLIKHFFQCWINRWTKKQMNYRIYKNQKTCLLCMTSCIRPIAHWTRTELLSLNRNLFLLRSFNYSLCLEFLQNFSCQGCFLLLLHVFISVLIWAPHKILLPSTPLINIVCLNKPASAWKCLL